MDFLSKSALLGGLAVPLLVAIPLLAIVAWFLFRVRPSAAEKERRRRLLINSTGRIRDAEITDAREGALYYSYMVSGVCYTASQDVSNLKELLPDDLCLAIGPGAVKYLTQNPADSIVICEEWSGVRLPAHWRDRKGA